MRYDARNAPLDKYGDAVIEMLMKDFGINLSEAEKKHIRDLKTYGEISAAVKGVLNRHWE